MLTALEEHFGEHARWTEPQGGLFVWATLDERIDTTDLLAQARESEGVAFVPGRAAYMDGRRGSHPFFSARPLSGHPPRHCDC